MRVGFVGVGRIGVSHAEILRNHPEVGSLVVADAVSERAKAVAEKLGVEAAATVGDAIAGADALVITAATAAHPELIIRGVRAGIPIFCEKPVASDVAGHRAVLTEVQAVGVAVQIGFQRRFDAGYMAVRDALRSGLLGELRRVHVITADPAPPHAGYIPLSGGIFRDLHVHDFDLLRWVTGREVVDVYAAGAARGADFIAAAGDVDESAALLTLDDDTLVTSQGSRYNGAGYDVRMEVAGTERTWVVGLDDGSPVVSAEPRVSFPSGSPYPSFWDRFTSAYIAEINAFVDVAKGRRESPCTVQDALEAFYVAEAATLSRQERRPVTIAEVRAG